MAAARDTLGRPLRDLRISVTDRCNFRCPYCMPKEAFGPGHAFLPTSRLMTRRELVRIVRAFVGLGVEKIRLTGGEPLLRPDLPAIVRALKRGPGRARRRAHDQRLVPRKAGARASRRRPRPAQRLGRLARRGRPRAA